jgi:hypothetical protein
LRHGVHRHSSSRPRIRQALRNAVSSSSVATHLWFS